MKKLSKEFFNRDTVTVARELVGKMIQVDDVRARILETEAYKDDLASHARKRTPRSELMYTTYGHVYVYLIYGMYYCLNITTEDGKPGAVLIRALDHPECTGPGKLCKILKIGKEDNGQPLGNRFNVYDDGSRPKVKSSARIGIKDDMHLKWRFFMEKDF